MQIKSKDMKNLKLEAQSIWTYSRIAIMKIGSSIGLRDCLEITWTTLRRRFLANWRRKDQRNSQSYLAGFATISWPKRSSKVVQVISRQSLSIGICMAAGIGTGPYAKGGTADRYSVQNSVALQRLLNNLNIGGVPAGFVIASPSRSNPDYFFHWTRDAAMTMLEIVRLYSSETDLTRKHFWKDKIQKWIALESQFQIKSSRDGGGLGEPKYLPNGEVFRGPWGRPQNDGPGIRSMVMTSYAGILLNEGTKESQGEALALYRGYNGMNEGPIKKDLEYTAHHWMEISFDLWEEVKGQHFFTLMAQRTALVVGANLARIAQDYGAASFYDETRKSIESKIYSHVDKGRGIILNTLQHEGDGKGKNSNLDSAVLLASLYFSLDDGFFDLRNTHLQRTVEQVEESFRRIYSINQAKDLGSAIGRYPEDVYNGVGFGEGNPWFLTTAAYAEYYCRIGNNAKGLSYLNRIIYHLNQEGSMSEQINKTTGFEQGAVDLSWSYVSYLRAYKVCFH